MRRLLFVTMTIAVALTALSCAFLFAPDDASAAVDWWPASQEYRPTYAVAYNFADSKVYVAGYGCVYTYDSCGNWADIGHPGIFTSLAFNPADSSIYGASDAQVFRYDGGQSWSSAGTLSADVTCLAYNPSDQKLYAGTSRTVFRRNEGTSWTSVGGLGSYGVTSLVYNVSDQSLYAGTGGGGVNKYLGGGEWTRVGGMTGTTSAVLGYNPFDQRLYAGCTQGYVSSWDGTSWYYETAFTNPVHSFCVNTSESKLYASAGDSVYRLEDNGQWTNTGGPGEGKTAGQLAYSAAQARLCLQVQRGMLVYTNRYVVSAAVVGGGGTVTPEYQVLEPGGTAALTINLTTGSRISSITDNGVPQQISNPYSIENVAGDHDLKIYTAHGDPERVSARVEGGHGRVLPDYQEVEYRADATVDIVPDLGYHIASITDNGIPQTIADPYVIHRVWTDHEVVVTFEVSRYAVSAAAAGPGGEVSPASQTVTFGSTAEIEIEVEEGYYISSINDNGYPRPIASPYVIAEVDQDHDIVVEFQVYTYDVIAISTNSGGEVTPYYQVVEHGNSVGVMIYPREGYHASSILDNGISVPVRDIYVIDSVGEDHSIYVTFAVIKYPVRASVHNGGGIVFPKAQDAVHGSRVGIRMKPDAGCRVAWVKDNGAAVSPVPKSLYVLDRVDRAHDIEVAFEHAPPPVSTFFFAEGTCRPGFDPYICIQNPGDVQAEVRMTYMAGDGHNTVQEISVDPRSRATVRCIDVLGTADDPAHDFSSKVECTNGQVIIVERPMYFDYHGWPGGSDVVGAVAPAMRWYFAEGTCRPNFVSYLCIQDPFDVPSDVRITYYKGDGKRQEQELVVPSRSRVTVPVRDVIGTGDDAAHDFSCVIETTNAVEIVAERSLFFSYQGRWTGGTAVMGAARPSSTLYLAEGCCRPGFESYLCLFNTEDRTAYVEVEFMLGDGKTLTQVYNVRPNARFTVPMRDVLGSEDDARHDFSAKIRCISGQKIVVERPMYFDYHGWFGGSDVVASPAPVSGAYFAEGTCRPGFQPFIAIQNPGDKTASVSVTYMRGDGTSAALRVAIAPRSRATVRPSDVLGAGEDVAHDFSTAVLCTNGQKIVTERPMYFNYHGALTGGSAVMGYTPPALARPRTAPTE